MFKTVLNDRDEPFLLSEQRFGKDTKICRFQLVLGLEKTPDLMYNYNECIKNNLRNCR